MGLVRPMRAHSIYDLSELDQVTYLSGPPFPHPKNPTSNNNLHWLLFPCETNCKLTAPPPSQEPRFHPTLRLLWALSTPQPSLCLASGPVSPLKSLLVRQGQKPHTPSLECLGPHLTEFSRVRARLTWLPVWGKRWAAQGLQWGWHLEKRKGRTGERREGETKRKR